MIGDQRREIPILCTAEEAVFLRGYATIESVQMANDIYHACLCQDAHSGDRSNDEAWSFYKAIATIYDAGRIQGIREERSRRNRQGKQAP